MGSYPPPFQLHCQKQREGIKREIQMSSFSLERLWLPKASSSDSAQCPVLWQPPGTCHERSGSCFASFSPYSSFHLSLPTMLENPLPWERVKFKPSSLLRCLLKPYLCHCPSKQLLGLYTQWFSTFLKM